MMGHAEAAVEPDVLQDRVFVVSLIRVLTDTFGSSKDLYHKLKQKPDSDDEHENMEDAKQSSSRGRQDSHSNLSEALGRHVRWSLDRRDMHRSDSEDKLICTASSQVQTTYDHGYRKLGEVYARGDNIAKIQLQSHIIKLQQTLIRIHQDLMLSNYLAVSSSHSQRIQLVQTVRTTRAGAIQALDLLCQRLLASPPGQGPNPHPPMPGAFPQPPRSRRSSSSSSSSDSHTPVPSKPPTKPTPTINELFCRYALELQNHPRRPLSQNFTLGGSNRCPICCSLVPIRPNKAWEVIVDSAGRRSRGNRFLVRNRFVIKCHRASGGFACILCASHGDADTVCRSLEALMEHLWKEHTSEDMERDCDIVEC
ncbi:uncharacterized protein EKO05_0004170 [Ascochyta rabiei]|uniref:uncharacterized protein n=1 Tax=Didymella rabiei TaxID=5454 RepID=UPI0021F9C8D8|nr:uncharacterized protein EKO05_0004170 [Ascochyta rabiei]UPX13670.1 hypothetical protein EKO05_0004170 [Ascochyta rabiei]